MIRHIIFFSAKNIGDLKLIEQGLNLLADIPEAKNFHVARNIKSDALSTQIDLVVFAEFADHAALTRYKQHVNYQRSIDIVRPLRDLRIAADYEIKG